MYVMLAGVEGEITASHLSMFSVRPCDVANSLTTLIWSWQSEMFVDRVRMLYIYSSVARENCACSVAERVRAHIYASL